MASQASLQMFEGMIGVLMPGRKAFLHPYGDDDDNYACDFQMRAPLEEILPPLPAEDARPGSLHSDIAAASVNESPLHEGLSFRMRGSKLGVCNNRHEMCGWGVHKRPTKLCEFVEGASYHPSGGNETLSSGKKKKKKVCPGWLHGQQSQIGSQGDLGGLDSRQKQVLVDRIPETFAVVPEANVAHENNMVRAQDDIFGPQRGYSCFRSEDLCESEEEASDPSKSDDEMTTHQQHGEDAEVLGDYIPLDIHDAGMSQKSLSQQVCSKRRKESSVLNSTVHNKESDKHIGNAGVLECPHQEIENDQLGESKTQVDEPGSVATLQQHLSQDGVQHCENDWSEQTEEGREVLGKVFQRSVESSKQDPGNWADLDVESLVRESPLASTSNRGELPSVVEEDSIEQEMIKEEALREAPLSAGEEPPASASNRNNSDVDAHNYSCSQGSHSSPLASEREGTESTGISLRAREPVVLRSRAAGLPPDVGIVVIEDDDDDDDNNEEEDKEDEDGEGDAFDSYDDTDSDAGSKRHPLQTDPVPVSRPAAPALRKTSNTFPEFSSSGDDSDSDDCQVLSWCPAQKKLVSHSIQREPEHNAKKVYSPESSQCTERENESSDIEIMRGSQGVIRQQWEEAALKRRMGRVMQSEGSKAGRNSRMGQPSNLGRRNSASSPPGSKEQGVSEPAQRAHDTHQQHGPMPSQGLAESVATSTDSDGQIGIESRVRGEHGVDVVPCASSYEEQLPDIGVISTGREQFHQVFPNSPRGLQEVPVEIATLFPGRPSGRDLAEELDDQYLQGEPCGWMQNWFEERVTSHRIDGACTSRQDEFKGMTEGGLLAPKVIPDLNIREGQAAETKSEALIGSGIIGEREKMKQSVEFQRADEEEWARRDLELQRQAQEAQKLRKRKRAEADRKMEMESRQKQRLEEIRLLQQQEEWNMGLKEQLRGQVQKRLESLAYGCSDMATLLRRLGIAVEGGTYPSPQEVNSAYKKALLRFHPDRASSLAQGDPQGQVEAEETFKLISRMKNTLSLVSSPTFNSFW